MPVCKKEEPIDNGFQCRRHRRRRLFQPGGLGIVHGRVGASADRVFTIYVPLDEDQVTAFFYGS